MTRCSPAFPIRKTTDSIRKAIGRMYKSELSFLCILLFF